MGSFFYLRFPCYPDRHQNRAAEDELSPRTDLFNGIEPCHAWLFDSNQPN
jgi:hypothetical protein